MRFLLRDTFHQGWRVISKRFAILATVTLALCGCQSAPKKNELVSEGHWTGSTKIRDKQSGKSYSVSVEIFAREPGQLRLEARGMLSTPLVSVVVDKENTSYLIFDSKIFYQGPTNEEALAPVIQMRLHPQILLDVLFAKPLRGQGWSCISNPRGGQDCTEKLSRLSLSWQTDKGGDRKVKIDHPRVEMHLDLELDEAKVGAPEKVFALKIPKSFSRKN